jgi:hypothetical protein
MQDVAYLRQLAERYRKLARKIVNGTIRDRLESAAEELEDKIRDLQRVPRLLVERPCYPVH